MTYRLKAMRACEGLLLQLKDYKLDYLQLNN